MGATYVVLIFSYVKQGICSQAYKGIIKYKRDKNYMKKDLEEQEP